MEKIYAFYGQSIESRNNDEVRNCKALCQTRNAAINFICCKTKHVAPFLLRFSSMSIAGFKKWLTKWYSPYTQKERTKEINDGGSWKMGNFEALVILVFAYS